MLRCAITDTRHGSQLTTFLHQTKYVAYHDINRRDLYISSDEGKNWQRVTDIPQGDTALFIEHPFNNRMVSVSSSTYPLCGAAVPRLVLRTRLYKNVSLRDFHSPIIMFLALEALGLETALSRRIYGRVIHAEYSWLRGAHTFMHDADDSSHPRPSS